MPEMNNQPIRIFLLDAFTLERACLKFLLENQAGMIIAGEAGDTQQGLKLIAEHQPDVLLLKLNPAGDPCLDSISQITQAWKPVKIILLTTTDDMQTCLQTIQEGVIGIVSMFSTPAALIKAIEKVYAGEIWIERSMIAKLLTTRDLKRRPDEMSLWNEVTAELSERERQVIELIGKGMKNQQIAIKLCISESTVRHHLTSIYNKLGVTDRLELLVLVHSKGLVK